ncbi:hypothetical protein L873DRAFT_1830295 [Choiromyces venosus 120613-1]|uniref:DDE Tnp4 domain-containing protein n=1 Tax=Choiromyces venosus 120613-1 TaxID=1336337 RepID=A0A3N4J8H5_9PEZI|nr:hypothetical protein L873DRAFT_1830295 [Choiromyces venosus 120613-1]
MPYTSLPTVRSSPMEALFILLYRLSYSHRLKDCLKIFGCSQTRLSVIFNDLVAYLISRYAEKLVWDRERLTISMLCQYAEAVKCVTGLPGIWGFVDGTMRPFCCPGEDQNVFYSGYKKTHVFKFQSIVTPDGLLSSLIGPFPGPVGDWVIWRSSGIVEILHDLFEESGISETERLYVYGDSAYTPAFGVMGPFLAHVNKLLTTEEEVANIVMSGLKLGLSPIAGYYMVATLLSNILLCISGGNQVSEKYHLLPLTVEEYLYILNN